MISTRLVDVAITVELPFGRRIVPLVITPFAIVALVTVVF